MRMCTYHSDRYRATYNDVAVLIEPVARNASLTTMASVVLVALLWASLTLQFCVALRLRLQEHFPLVPRSETAPNDALFFDVSS